MMNNINNNNNNTLISTTYNTINQYPWNTLITQFINTITVSVPISIGIKPFFNINKPHLFIRDTNPESRDAFIKRRY